MEVKKDILWRVYLLYFGACLIGLAIIFKIGKLQFVEGDYWKQKAEETTTELKTIEASRGNIYADDGATLLATDLPFYEVHMDVNADAITTKIFNTNIDSLSYCLAQLFKNKSAKEYRNEFVVARKNGARYHLIQRNVSFNDLKKLQTFPIIRMGRFKGGLIVMQTNKRKMPFQLLAQRTIGYKMKNGVIKIEGKIDSISLGFIHGKIYSRGILVQSKK